MTITVVDPDPTNPDVPHLDQDGQPVSTTDLPDGTIIKQVNGWPMAMTAESSDFISSAAIDPTMTNAVSP